MKIYKDEKIKGIEIIDSEILGPVIAIIGGLHGDEPCGLKVLEYVKNNIKLKNGKIFLIEGNPKAIKNNVRQTEANVNRIFKPENELSEGIKKTYEYKRSREIMKILDQCDLMLDIHSSSIKDTVPFTICDKKNNNLTNHFPLVFSCSGFDQMEPGASDYYMNQNGKSGICIECGYHDDLKTTELGISCVETTLSNLGMIEKEKGKILSNHKNLEALELYKTKTDNFRLEKEFANFEKINKGQKIATDGEESITAEKDCYIIFAHNRNKKNDEGFILLKEI